MKLLSKAATILKKKGIFPLKLSQTIHFPKGDLHIVSVGKLTGPMVTQDQLVKVKEEVLKLKDIKPKKESAFLFFPPIVKVKEIICRKGKFFLVTLGDLKHGLIPSYKDLESFRDLFVSQLKSIGAEDACMIFYPPILHIENNILDAPNEIPLLFLGDTERNIVPSKPDGLQLKKLFLEEVKPLGIKKCMVTPMGGHWASPEPAFV